MNERPGPSDYTAPSPADAPTAPARLDPGLTGRAVTEPGVADPDPSDPGAAGREVTGREVAGREVTDPDDADRADVVADPALAPVRRAGSEAEWPPISEALTVPEQPAPTGLIPERPGRSRMSGTWIGMVLGAVVLVFLLVFILQNPAPARVAFLGLEATLPLGIWLLFAAIAGVLLLAIPGIGRFTQWRRSVPRSRTSSSRWGTMRR